MAPSAESSTNIRSSFAEALLVPLEPLGSVFDRFVSGESSPRASAAVLLVPKLPFVVAVVASMPLVP